MLVVLAYFSRSKSTLPQRRAQPNQKERIQPQSREEREAESKYVEVALCSLIQSKQTPDWIFYKNSPQTLAVKKVLTFLANVCWQMLSEMENKLRQGIKMQHDVPAWLRQGFRGESESREAHKAPTSCRMSQFFKRFMVQAGQEQLRLS